MFRCLPDLKIIKSSVTGMLYMKKSYRCWFVEVISFFLFFKLKVLYEGVSSPK